MRNLAESLSPAARRLFLRDGAELEQESARTRAFISKFRLPNPLRVMHAKAYEIARAGAEPSRLMPDEREVVDALQFHFSGEYECIGNMFDRWVAPDGCIYIECSADKRFLSVNFEDDHRISMRPDLADGTEELWPTTKFLINSADLVDDYRRMLEAVAARIEETSIRPLYRYADSELDHDCMSFYLRHQVAMEYVTFATKQRFWTSVGEKMPTLGEGVMSEQEARDFIATFTVTARLTDHDVVQTCESCNEKVYIEFADIGPATRCTGCEKQIGSAMGVVLVYNAAAFDQLLQEIKIPVVACFWSPQSWTSVSSAGILHDATLRNDQRYLAVLIDALLLDELAARNEISEMPTFVRFRDGIEVGRHLGPITVDGVLAFARG